jgi:hypothetical protein
MIGLSSAFNYCYQGTANVSNSCGGLGTGNYTLIGTAIGTGGLSSFWDEDWASYLAPNTDAQVFVNWSVPQFANTNLSKYELRINYIWNNFTTTSTNPIPQECMDKRPISFRYGIYSAGANYQGNFSCLNNTGWQLINRTFGADNVFKNLYEEAFYWYIADDYKEVTDIYNTTSYVGFNEYALNITYNSTYYTSPSASFYYNNSGTQVSVGASTIFETSYFGNNTLYYRTNVYINSSFIGNNSARWVYSFYDTSLAKTIVFNSSQIQDIVIFNDTIVTYNASTLATKSEKYVLNLTIGDEVTSIDAVLFYNNTNYTATKISQTSDDAVFQSVIDIPENTQTSTNTFYWRVNITYGATEYIRNTPNYTQSINSITSMTTSTTACASGFLPALKFTYFNENLTSMNATSKINLQYGIGNTNSFITNTTITNKGYFLVCINQTYEFFDIGYGEIEYYYTDFSNRRYFLFENTRLTNVSTNYSLYLLPTASITTYKFIVNDNQYNAQPNLFVGLLRWYPELNEYKVVEIEKTDGKGEAIFSLVTNSVTYRIAIYQEDGTLLKLFEPIIFVCPTSQCEYNLFLDPEEQEIDKVYEIQQSLVFNSSSKILTYIWNDPTQSTTTINLSVYKDYPSGSVAVCSKISNSFTGVLTCDLSAQTGNMRAIVLRTASPNVQINSLMIFIGQVISDTAQGKTIGLVLSLGFMVFAILIGLFNPVFAIFMGLVGLIPALFFGAISLPVFIGVGILGFLIIHFIRRA